MATKKEFMNQVNQQFAKLTEFITETQDYDLMCNELQKMTHDMMQHMPECKIEVINEYQNYIDEMLSIADNYKSAYQKLDDEMKQNTRQLEYSSGGECIHRGYHCPSPILDRVVGGCKRGKRIKRVTANSKNYYIYHYNDRYKMIGVEKYVDSTCYEKEFIIEKAMKLYGISYYMDDLSIGLISMETYDEEQHLKHYITILPDNVTGKNRHNIRTSEKYIYNERNQLQKVLLVLEGYPSLSMLNEEEILCEIEAKS